MSAASASALPLYPLVLRRYVLAGADGTFCSKQLEDPRLVKAALIQ